MSRKSRKKRFASAKNQQQNNLSVNTSVTIQTPRQVYIVDTYYTEETNLVEWKVIFEDGRELILAIDGDELGYMLNFDIIFTPELIKQACKEFKGKTKMLLLNQDINVNEDKIEKLKDISEKQLDEKNKEMYKYPLGKVVETIHNSAVRKTKEDLTIELNNKLNSIGVSVQLVKKNSKTEKLTEEFWFGGVWKSVKKLNDTEINRVFTEISRIAQKYGLITERLPDFSDGFFIIRAIK